MAHAWDWAIWKAERAPGWWTAISTDPPIELRARTEGDLRARMLLAERGHATSPEQVGAVPLIDVEPAEVVGARRVVHPVRDEVPDSGHWEAPCGMDPVYERRAKGA